MFRGGQHQVVATQPKLPVNIGGVKDMVGVFVHKIQEKAVLVEVEDTDCLGHLDQESIDVASQIV